MSKFTVRVELRQATEDDYEKQVAQSLCLSNSAVLKVINIH
jgi:hypothetical protein